MKLWSIALLGIMLLVNTTAFAAGLGKTTVDLDGRQAYTQETNLGNFLADALRNASGADIAVLQAKALRDNVLLPAGSVDEQVMRDSLRMPSSQIVILTMKPVLLKQMLERAVSRAPEVNDAFLQVSGIQLTYNSAKQANDRIETMTLNGKALDPLDDATDITVAMPRELGMGGAGYYRIFEDNVEMAETTTTMMDAIKQEFTRLGGKISPVLEGRIKDSNVPKPN